MTTRRAASALAGAVLALSVLVGCGSADNADDHNDKPRVTASASAPAPSSSPSSAPSQSFGNPAKLPPESGALKPGEGKDVAQEQKAIDHGTPDSCRLFTGVQYSKVLGYDKPVVIKSHGGGPYYPDYRRNCYVTNEPSQNALTGELISIYPDNGVPAKDRSQCAIVPLGEEPPARESCMVINLDPYESGFDSNVNSANITAAWIKQVRDQDGILVTMLFMTTSDGYIAYADTYVEDAGRMLGLGKLMGNALREELGLKQ